LFVIHNEKGKEIEHLKDQALKFKEIGEREREREREVPFQIG
jgi:hypothetical protein